MTESLTPTAIEGKLRMLVSDLTRAQKDLAKARDVEVAAKHEFETAHRRAILSPECPTVSRGGVTTAERDAWVAERAFGEQQAFDIAEARRRAAEDHLRTLRDQSMVVMALNRSVLAAYGLAGVDER